MSARIVSVARRRVTLAPRPRALATSSSFARVISAQIASSDRRPAKVSKKPVIASSASLFSSAKAVVALSMAVWTAPWTSAGT